MVCLVLRKKCNNSIGLADMERGLICPAKAKEFDKLHAKVPKYGRKGSGAKELASGYTSSKLRVVWGQ